MSSAPPLLQPFTDDSAKASVLAIIIEPLVVISLLTAGVIFNRRSLSTVSSPVATLPSHTGTPHHPSFRSIKPPDTPRFANNRISATLYRFPFLIEVFYWGLTYWVYQIARAVSDALFIDDGTANIARRHAIQLIEFERRIGIQWENKVQDTIIRHAWAIFALNWIYSYIHIPATITFLVCFYHTQPFHVYASVRRTMVLATLLTVIVSTLWPCMPPRLLPTSYGFVDTVHKYGAGSVWTTNIFCNSLAAMPSLHFGYALIVGTATALCAHSPSPAYFRALFLLYPALILLVIVATANYCLLDALAGVVVAALARYANAALVPLLALENALFCLLHIHKPLPAHLVESQSVQDMHPHFAADDLEHLVDGTTAWSLNLRNTTAKEIYFPIFSQTRRRNHILRTVS